MTESNDLTQDAIIPILERIELKLDRLLAGLHHDDESVQHDPILESQDVCQLLRMSLRQLRRLKTTGQLEGFKVGRRRFWRQSDVDAYIRRHEIASRDNH